VSSPIAFVSHSSDDAVAARRLVELLRGYGVDSWIDHEQIRFGDSIPGRIAEGLSAADVILVLVSEAFVESSWCRAEYEPLLQREIESGRTAVIPLRLDDATMPVLLSAKRYVDLRNGLDEASVGELAETILSERSEAFVRRLLPKAPATEAKRYECSILTMIIAKVIKDFPVAAMTREKLLRGRSLIDLYRTVETLVERYQNLCDEILDVLVEADIGHHFYGSARRIPERRLEQANRKLLDIANDMREMTASLDSILDPESPLRQRFTDVLGLCTQISVAEDFLLILLGAPPEVPRRSAGYEIAMSGRYTELAAAGISVFDNIHAMAFLGELGGQMVRDFERVLRELDTYKMQLRAAIANGQDG